MNLYKRSYYIVIVLTAAVFLAVVGLVSYILYILGAA